MTLIEAKFIHVKGLVQGVGFRPFIYRIAIRNEICGWVENGNDGVRIHAEGAAVSLARFIDQIKTDAPDASNIIDINVTDTGIIEYSSFEIRRSSDDSDEITEISPDIAVCPDCLADMKTQHHRLDYPLINCTNCGPRFSIIQGLPYDRPKTTMSSFRMCEACKKEYTDVLDRRFHAQPVACNHCGPHYTLAYGSESISGTSAIVSKAAELIGRGLILAIKGTGGFQLVCDALKNNAVNLLRSRKNREGKPFAVMFKDIDTAGKFLEISEEERKALQSWRRPIVILKNREMALLPAAGVSNGFNTTGAILPYMPMHYLLFEKLSTPAIIFTSGNIADEPVVIDNEAAVEQLGSVADAFLHYDRDIYNRTDDSVMLFTGDQPRIIRRSRGFAPAPVELKTDADGIFASGAELVNCFCVGKGKKAFLSQHIGDLKNLETLDFYSESLTRFMDMFRVKPRLAVCDLHPDYLSTRFAEEFASAHNIPLIRVQHHHAHIAACMAEHSLDEKVVGISLDGVGYGSDGHIWGFEVMECDLSDFSRKIHLEYIPQPGGDLANFEPWRMGLAYLDRYSDRTPEGIHAIFGDQVPVEKIEALKNAINLQINSPLVSSAGRLFDAVAAITGVCLYSSFHAEAPMRLENLIDESEKGRYEFRLTGTINPELIIKGILDDLDKKTAIGRISAKFHRSVVDMIVQSACRIKSETGLSKAVLSGGSFQNRFILSNAETELAKNNFEVFTHKNIPSNDGGIALGQLIIASKRRDV